MQPFTLKEPPNNEKMKKKTKIITNTDKYLRKNVDIKDLTSKLIEYAYKEKKGNLFEIMEGFFAQEAVPTLKDMEDPMFWNLEDNTP